MSSIQFENILVLGNEDKPSWTVRYRRSCYWEYLAESNFKLCLCKVYVSEQALHSHHIHAKSLYSKFLHDLWFGTTWQVSAALNCIEATPDLLDRWGLRWHCVWLAPRMESYSVSYISPIASNTWTEYSRPSLVCTCHQNLYSWTARVKALSAMDQRLGTKGRSVITEICVERKEFGNTEDFSILILKRLLLSDPTGINTSWDPSNLKWWREEW